MMFGNLVLETENGKTLEYDFAAQAVIDDSKSTDPRFTFSEGRSVSCNYIEDMKGGVGKDNAIWRV